jgi:hypothetical protein
MFACARGLLGRDIQIVRAASRSLATLTGVGIGFDTKLLEYGISLLAKHLSAGPWNDGLNTGI